MPENPQKLKDTIKKGVEVLKRMGELKQKPK